VLTPQASKLQPPSSASRIPLPTPKSCRAAGAAPYFSAIPRPSPGAVPMAQSRPGTPKRQGVRLGARVHRYKGKCTAPACNALQLFRSAMEQHPQRWPPQVVPVTSRPAACILCIAAWGVHRQHQGPRARRRHARRGCGDSGGRRRRPREACRGGVPGEAHPRRRARCSEMTHSLMGSGLACSGNRLGVNFDASFVENQRDTWGLLSPQTLYVIRYLRSGDVVKSSELCRGTSDIFS